MRDFKIIQAHYGEKHSFWRVVVTSEWGEEFKTVGKFPTKEEAEKYVTCISQGENRSITNGR